MAIIEHGFVEIHIRKEESSGDWSGTGRCACGERYLMQHQGSRWAANKALGTEHDEHLASLGLTREGT